MSVKRKYLKALEEIENIKKEKGKEGIKEILDMLRSKFEGYNWVGIYVLKDGVLKLLEFSGEKETEHKVIPVERGLCGMAVREKRIVNVYDVSSSKEYLQCFPETKSEIVVPIFKGERIVGEIDIDSYKIGAFNENDEWFLARVAEIISDLLD